MSSKPKFDNKKVTALLERYIKTPEDEELRNHILRKALPLIEAALHRKHVSLEMAEDIRQDCAMKLLRNLHRYKKGRGSAFAFLWTVICNHVLTQIKRKTSKNVSLTGPETDSGEMEVVQEGSPSTPESQYILQRIGKDLEKSFEIEGFRKKRGKKHGRAVKLLQASIRNTKLFKQRTEIIKKLHHLGLSKEEAKHYIDFALVKIRQSLLRAREESLGLGAAENKTNVPSFSSRGIFGDFRRTEHDKTD